MPNGDYRSWVPFCAAVDGFRNRFGEWPSIVRLGSGYVTDLREILGDECFRVLQEKLLLHIDEQAHFIAEDQFGRAYDYSREGVPQERPRPSTEAWLIMCSDKVDEELTKAMNEIVDEWARQSKERYLRERAAAERDRERRIRESLPLGDDCYFARFTKGMHVRDEDLADLWHRDKVAVHLTESGVESGSSRQGDLDPKDYPGNERQMVSTLLRLSERGGYVWFENRSGRRAKVGVVRPGTPIEDFEAHWAETKNPKYKAKVGTKTTLMTLQLEKVGSVWLNKATMLRACRPLVLDHVGRSILSWRPACGTSRLVYMFDRYGTEDPEARWNALSPDLQKTVCVEFLRYHDKPHYPNLKRLLLPPMTMGKDVGVSDKDVDVYGVEEDGTEILAQVPFRSNRDKEGLEAGKKVRRLQKYRDSGAKLVCFVPGFGTDEEDAAQDQKLFEDRPPIERDGVLLIPVREVLEWVEEQPAYAERLFSA
jgi:hypothetical protein